MNYVDQLLTNRFKHLCQANCIGWVPLIGLHIHKSDKGIFDIHTAIEGYRLPGGLANQAPPSMHTHTNAWANISLPTACCVISP